MGRLIVVGDSNQAIYGWRGAHSNSMDVLVERFACQDLPLSITYRCPVAVVEHARQWVPELEAREDAPWGVVLGEETDWEGQADIALSVDCQCTEGEREDCYQYKHHNCSSSLSGITKWRGHLTDFLPGDAILCRVNRPLVAVAFALIRAKVPARVLGRDIGQGLAALARKLGKAIAGNTTSFPADFQDELSNYRDKQGGKLRRRGKLAEAAALDDRLDTLQVFVDELADEDGLQELLGSITKLFGEAGEVRASVILSTVHKSKGMEWDRVFILDASELMPSPWARKDWEVQQELHIQYVAATRAKRELRYIKSESLLHGGE